MHLGGEGPVLPAAGKRRLRRGPLRPPLRYDPATRHLTARAAIAATATTRLRGVRPRLPPHPAGLAGDRRRARGDLHPARHARARPGGDPRRSGGARATGSGPWCAMPGGRRPSPTRTARLDGWIETKDGAFVAGEPQGAPTWFPCNDTPRDKARYDFRVTVPHRHHGDRQRRARRPRHPARSLAHLPLAQRPADGDVPRHRDHRRLPRPHRDDARRHPLLHRHRPEGDGGEPGRPATRCRR